jgi:hypothetical protein
MPDYKTLFNNLMEEMGDNDFMLIEFNSVFLPVCVAKNDKDIISLKEKYEIVLSAKEMARLLSTAKNMETVENYLKIKNYFPGVLKEVSNGTR